MGVCMLLIIISIWRHCIDHILWLWRQHTNWFHQSYFFYTYFFLFLELYWIQKKIWIYSNDVVVLNQFCLLLAVFAEKELIQLNRVLG